MNGSADIHSLSGSSRRPGRAARRQRPQQGFSLIELMIGLVLVATLLSIGIPSFRSFILEQRLRGTSSDLRIALMTARAEAVKRNREVTLQSSADGWSKGWTIPNPVDPNDPDIDLLNHVQSGDVTITVFDSASVLIDDVPFTAAGRAKAPPGLVQLQIDIGSDPEEVVSACLERQLDGRVHSCRGKCPFDPIDPDPNEPLDDPCDGSDESRTL